MNRFSRDSFFVDKQKYPNPLMILYFSTNHTLESPTREELEEKLMLMDIE